MATPSVNFLSYNGTGLDTVKSRWLRDLLKVIKIDFIPAFREKERDSGRAKGWLNSLLQSTK